MVHYFREIKVGTKSITSVVKSREKRMYLCQVPTSCSVLSPLVEPRAQNLLF